MIRNSIRNISQTLIHRKNSTSNNLNFIANVNIAIQRPMHILNQDTKPIPSVKRSYNSNKNSNNDRQSNSNTDSQQRLQNAFKLGLFSAAATTMTIIVILNSSPSLYISSDCNLISTTFCDSTSVNDNHGYIVPFSRNFVADAAEISSPAVVNVMTQIEGFMMVGASAGSGFIISKDGRGEVILNV